MKTSRLNVHGEQAGRQRRKTIPRKALATWDGLRRKRAFNALLNEASISRISALLKLKHDRMAASPFSFFRGAAVVMAYDLSLFPHTSIISQLCGDAHVQNLGAYEGIDGELIFDINDFDETIRGPFEWDLKRMATSLLLAGHDAKLGSAACNSAAAEFLSAYCALMQQFATMSVLGVARYPVRSVNEAAPVAALLAQAQRASPLHLRDKLTEVVSGKRVFRSNPPLLRRVEEGRERDEVLASLRRYRESLLPERQHFFDQFALLDVAFKVVGTGSVGLRDYCIFLQGNGPDDPLVLQIKQEVPSVYRQYLKKSKSAGLHEGQRVADGQRAMQLQSDPMLGWTTFGKLDYLVRQLNDHKATLDVTQLGAPGLAAYARVCGEILARGHARSGDAAMIAGYIGRSSAFSNAILQYAGSYAEQTRSDHAAFVSAGKV